LEAAARKVWSWGIKMKKVRVNGLSGWPPTIGGALAPGEELPTGGNVVVTEIVPFRGELITVKAALDGRSWSYHFKPPNETIGRRFHGLVQANIGKTVSELGELEIEV